MDFFMTKWMYLDFDGVVHDDAVYCHPKRGIYVSTPGRTLFEWSYILEELVEALATAITELGEKVGIEMNLKAQGVTQEVLDATVDRMAELAYEDQCTTANPKQPLISELKQIIIDSYNA